MTSTEPGGPQDSQDDAAPEPGPIRPGPIRPGPGSIRPKPGSSRPEAAAAAKAATVTTVAASDPHRFGRVDPDGTIWLPFWRVPVRAKYGGRLAHRAVDLRNVLGVIRAPIKHPRAAPDDQLCYYVAAFGALRAPRVDHAARDMTMAQPLLKRGERGRGEKYHCFFSADDAQRLGYTTLIRIITGTVPHRLRSMRVQAGVPRLWYMPFQARSHELANLVTGRRYDRGAFRGIRH